MEITLFKPSDPISVLFSLHDSKTACNNDSMHKVAGTWLFLYIIPELDKAIFSNRVTTDKKSN